MDADVPVPYGRTVPLPVPQYVTEDLDFQTRFQLLVPYAPLKQRKTLVAIMLSNCGVNNKRLDYVKEIQKYTQVDVYGGCGKELVNVCSRGGYGDDCDKIQTYLFYLSFENSNCNEYISEKAFSHGFRKGAIPVIMGSPRNVTELHLPPDSFLHVTDYSSPEELTKFILFINSTLEDNYLKYHEWRKHFKVLNEHGYLHTRSYHYCRLCEALNYNDESQKIINKEQLGHFLDPKVNCDNAH